MVMRIPTYQQSTLPQAVGMPRANVAPMVDERGAALADAGRSLQRAAVMQMEEKQRLEQQDAVAWVGEQLPAVREHWNERLQKMMQDAPEGAPGILDQFKEDFRTYREELIANAPSEKARMLLKPKLAELRTQLGEDTLRFAAKSQVDMLLGRIDRARETSANVVLADPTKADQLLTEHLGVIQATGIPASLKEKLSARARDDLTSAALDGAVIYAKDDPAALTRIEQEIDAGTYASVSTSRLAIIKGRIRDARTAIESGAADEERKRQVAVAGSDLEIAVRRGKSGYADIETAFSNGVISPAKRVELTTHLDSATQKANEAAAKRRDMLGRVNVALSGSVPLDYRTERDRDAVDAYYADVLAPSLAKLPPDEQSQAIADFSARTGIVPRGVREWIRGAFRAGQDADRVRASDMLDRLKTANPAVLDDFTANDIAVGNAITTYVRAGVQPQVAVKTAMDNMKLSEPEREARDQRYKSEKAPESNAKRLAKELTGFRMFSPSLPDKVPDAMSGEYETLVQSAFTRTGDLEVAQKTALDQLRRVWGVTNIDQKPRYMKFAPETVYQVPGESGAWIREQLHAEVTKGALFDGKPDLTLAADALTAREALPSYMVLSRKDGVLSPLLGKDGKPLRFRPDFASSTAGQRRTAALEAQRAAAGDILTPPGTIANPPGAAVTGGGAVSGMARGTR